MRPIGLVVVLTLSLTLVSVDTVGHEDWRDVRSGGELSDAVV
jgi:hypothetical protein